MVDNIVTFISDSFSGLPVPLQAVAFGLVFSICMEFYHAIVAGIFSIFKR